MAVNGVLNMIDYYLNPLVSLCRYEQLIGGKETLRRKASELGLPLWVGGESTESPLGHWLWLLQDHTATWQHS